MNEEESSDAEPRYLSAITRQVLLGVALSAGMLQAGLSAGWPAVLPSMQEDNSTSLVITDYDVKWLVSSTGIVGMLTDLVAGSLMEWVGPCRLLSLLMIPAAIFWLLQAFTKLLVPLYISRIVGSFIGNLVTTLANPLLAELFEIRIRGLLGCLPEIMVCLGILLVYLMAHLFSWRVVTALCAVPFVPLFFVTLYVPESPYWLVRRGRMEEADAALCSLRNTTSTARKEELLQIRRNILEYPQSTIIDQVKQLVVPHHARPLLLLVGIFILRELGGQFAVFSYTVYLFKRAGIQFDVFRCTVIVGLVRLVATLISSALLDSVGRRPFLIGTCIASIVAEIIGGITLLSEDPGASWVPLMAVLMFVFAYGLGVGPVPWVLLGELLPTPIRSIGASICNFFFSAMTFVIGLVFPELSANIGVGGSLLVFAIPNISLAVVAWYFLPETRGQSLHDLQDVFSTGTFQRSMTEVIIREPDTEEETEEPAD